ncbi:MAG: hypothetical protein Q8928_09955 [Bacteroidota bacterium]|nr:hypothetical protein [Bacteroidota bacterium]
MKRINLSLIATAIAAVIFSSCASLNKMKDQAKNISYTVTPSPLVVKGGQVEVKVDGNIPGKFFLKKATVVSTPVVKYNGQETALKSLTLQGESVMGNEKVIKFNEGGSFTFSDKFPYKKDMAISTLEVNSKATMGTKSVDFPSVKIADGIIATELLVVKDPRVIFAGDDKFVRTVDSKYQADIKYLINKADVRPTELKKAEIKTLNETLKDIDKDPKKQIKGIQVSAYASPDGPYDLNDKLAGKRKESASAYFTKEIKKSKIEKVKDDLFSYLTTAEDWDGFKELLQASNVKDKELVLRVLSMYSDPVVREKEIRNISAAFDEIKDKILPQLRRSKLTVSVENVGRTDAEILSMAQSTPDSLQLEDLLYAAKLTKDADKQLDIYKAAAKKYPNDFRAKNNIGYILFNQNHISEAKAAFEDAKKVENNNIAKNNAGVMAFLDGDLAKAEELFTSAVGAGDQVNYNLGIIKVIQGKYSEAISYFGYTPEVNSALAKLLNNDTNGALTILNSLKTDDALAYYLKAIIGSRTQNTELLFTNLRTACGKSAELKANAAKDMEFFKYFQDATFKSIVQ